MKIFNLLERRLFLGNLAYLVFPAHPARNIQDLVHSSEFSSFLRVNSFLRVHLQRLVHSSEFSSFLRVHLQRLVHSSEFSSFLRVHLQRLVHSPELTFISQMHQAVLYRMYNSLAFSSSLCIRYNTVTRVQSNTKNIVFFLEISSNPLVNLPCLLQVRWLLEDRVDPSVGEE